MSQLNPANRDPLTDAPGAHPIGTGIGAAGGAVTGAAAGSIGGPIGAAVGGIAGALVGGLAGKGAAEAVNPTVEDAYWRETYEREPYYQLGRSYDEYRPAYELGWSSARTADTGFDAVEPQLAHEWNSARATSQLDWEHARPATRAAWERARNGAPGTTASMAATAQGDPQVSDMDDVADVLDDLLESCRDGEYGFRAAAEHAESAELQSLFLRHSAECGAAALELEREIRTLGKEPSSGGTVAGALHRGWVSVKSVLTTHDDKAVLEECERGEDAAVARYRKALETQLPPALRSIVERQAQGAKRNHDEVRNLRDRYRTAS